ncbi:MAG: Asp-tRNA(Asn)/Glu-tRNA(Gln) amidotransferase subunit GatB [Candidatus Levyibacteriota bacterium]
MKDVKYQPIIGLEVHVELKTKSKMFCSCSAEYFGKDPNTHTCPVCLGLPGALPVPNKTAIDWCIMIGLALNCKIPLTSKFDRKNYFYPDLAKGYQISQYDKPFAINGLLKIKNQKLKIKNIRIRRVHMEEDTAKLIHSDEGFSLVDFNRSAVPLVEIVTEPDFENSTDVKEFLQKLQQIVRYLGVSNANMEKGEMRLEPNISLNLKNQTSKIKTTNQNSNLNNKLPPYKVEVKNINSFKFVEKAINYEIQRQEKILESGKIPEQETRGWDEKKQTTVTQRSKEQAHDYRYFPEPDIPPFRWTENQIRQLANQMVELPDQKFERFKKEYSLINYDAEILTREKNTAEYFEECVKVNQTDAKTIANWIINKRINIKQVLPAELIQQILKSTQTTTISDDELEKIVKEVLLENKKAINDYKNGKTQVLGFLIGSVNRKLKDKKVNTETIRNTIIKKLN